MNRFQRSLLTPAALLLSAGLIVGCADNSSSEGGNTKTTGGTDTPTETKGTQPDVNGDGKISIGVLSPGDTNDGGYYEAFVVAARAYTEENGWDLTIVDKVNAADGANQARNLCRQKVDMVAIAATENKDALSVADEDVCKNSVFAIFGDLETQLSPSVAQVAGQNNETQYLIGVAAGKVMAQDGSKVAGYVAGPELDFSVTAAKAFERGLKSVISDAKVLVTYTGSFDDGGKAREAVISQTSNGAKVIYTYLGGATEAAASAAKEAGAWAISPGTDRCDDPDQRFGVSGLFAPGLFFANMLTDFAEGKVEVGTTRTYQVGIDQYPSAVVCEVVENGAALQEEVAALATEIGAGKVDVGA